MQKSEVTETADVVPGVYKKRSPAGHLGLVARGFCMGSADVVPGVSGGTMAFILGIYEELINSIRMVGRPEFLRAVTRFQIGKALALVNWTFLLAVLAGIVLAVITLAPGIEYMLVNQPILIWSFFFGLVLSSVFVVSGRIQQWSPDRWIALILGTVGAFWLVGLVPVQTPTTWWFLFLSGAIAICAMILPGISGSFILLLMGKYEFFVSAVNQRDIGSLLIAAAGAAIGLVTFAQLLSWLFKRYHDLTVAVLTGFMLGSLRRVWPWKEVMETFVDRHGEEVPLVLRNVLPPLTVGGSFNMEVLYGLVAALIGFGLVLLLERLGNHSGQKTV